MASNTWEIRYYPFGYPEYQRLNFQINVWRPSVEISWRMCQSNCCRKNQRWRANLTIWMSNRLYQYTCLLLMKCLETSKCNWNEFRSKEIFYMIPKCIIVVTRQWNRNNRKTFMLWFWLFRGLRESIYSFSMFSGTGSTKSTLPLIQVWIVIMVTYCFRWCAINRIAIGVHSLQYDCKLWFSRYLSGLHFIGLKSKKKKKNKGLLLTSVSFDSLVYLRR